MDVPRYIALLIILPCLFACYPKDRKNWISAWKAASPLQQARSGFALAQSGPWLYIAGGVDGKDFLRSTEYARLMPGGGLGPWKKGPDMQQARGFFAMTAHKGFLYAVGGGQGPSGSQLLASVERAPIAADGQPGAWENLTQNLVIPRRCARLAIVGDRLLAIGGFGGISLDSVESARLGLNGELSNWQLHPKNMDIPRYVHAVAAQTGRIFVLGGHAQKKGTGLTEVSWSADGQMWHTGAALQQGRYGLSAVTYQQRIYAFGGMSGAKFLDTTEQADIRATGTSAWHMGTPLPMALAEFGAWVDSDQVFIIGGTHRDGYNREVFYANFNTNGDIGFLGHENEIAHPTKITQTDLPLQGQVVDVLQTDSYIFLNLRANDTQWWIATQGVAPKKGDFIRHGRGITMRDFFSKSANRTFAEIIFTSRAEKLP